MSEARAVRVTRVTDAASPLLRGIAFVAVVASAVGVIVAPGVKSVASQRVVEAMDRTGATLGYFLFVGLLVLAVRGVYELVRTSELSVPLRIVLLGGTGLVMAVAVPGVSTRLPNVASLVLAVATGGLVLTSSVRSAVSPSTRAVALVLGLTSLAALARAGVWVLADVALTRASVQFFSMASLVASLGVVLEAAGQAVTAAWLGTRRRWGVVLAVAGVTAAFLLTWGVVRGDQADPGFLSTVLHRALADAAGLPEPLGLRSLAVFVATGATPLALVVALQGARSERGVETAVATSLALALLARGRFDAPLRAMVALVASLWLLVALVDGASSREEREAGR
jgi:hypothetical protein